ncbi:small ribosomal subunit protein uS2m isoform X2 [Hydra vulgaris]|uniref:Small ribosomal subunit protein uS2m isoform X2 n=1 Tax=Hydra vulgaris TaxID=6087 RepID=A0ABM4D7X1_HYDVU
MSCKTSLKLLSRQVARVLIKKVHTSYGFVLNSQKISSIQGHKSLLEQDDFFDVKKLVDLKKLFDSRVHLGHHEGTWNPLTRPYIYGQRSTQLIIDLNQTVECLNCALNVLSHIVYNQGIVLFISTNPRFDYLIQKTARDCEEYFITHGWQKGLFTNSPLKLGTQKLPDLVIAFNNSRFEKTRDAIIEASMCNIPVIGIVDTDCDPRLITYPIPANDDTYDSVSHLCDIFKQAILNAKLKRNELN